jgi:hypothetical protein
MGKVLHCVDDIGAAVEVLVNDTFDANQHPKG